MRHFILIMAVAAFIITGCEQSSKPITTTSATGTQPEIVSDLIRFSVDGKNPEAWNSERENGTFAQHSQGVLITSTITDAQSAGYLVLERKVNYSLPQRGRARVGVIISVS